MTVESVTYISDLDDTNPPGGDPKSEGDNHIRNLKTGLTGSFPNFAGVAMTATEAELNIMDGVTATTAELNYLDNTDLTAADLQKLADITVSASQINSTLSFRGALVRNSGNQSVDSSSGTDLSWDTEEYDTDSIHESVTNPTRLTVPSGVTKVKLSGKMYLQAHTSGYCHLVVH